MIEARNLTRRYGRTVAVDALSFDVRPGSVTGFSAKARSIPFSYPLQAGSKSKSARNPE